MIRITRRAILSWGAILSWSSATWTLATTCSRSTAASTTMLRSTLNTAAGTTIGRWMNDEPTGFAEEVDVSRYVHDGQWHDYDNHWSGQNGNQSASGRPQVGAKSG